MRIDIVDISPDDETVVAIYADEVLQKAGDYYHDKIWHIIEGFIMCAKNFSNVQTITINNWGRPYTKDWYPEDFPDIFEDLKDEKIQLQRTEIYGD